MMFHAGCIIAYLNEEYYKDEYGNVFVGSSWVGKTDGPVEDFIKEKIKEYYNHNCNHGIVLRFKHGVLRINEQGEAWIEEVV